MQVKWKDNPRMKEWKGLCHFGGNRSVDRGYSNRPRPRTQRSGPRPRFVGSPRTKTQNPRTSSSTSTMTIGTKQAYPRTADRLLLGTVPLGFVHFQWTVDGRQTARAAIASKRKSILSIPLNWVGVGVECYGMLAYANHTKNASMCELSDGVICRIL